MGSFVTASSTAPDRSTAVLTTVGRTVTALAPTVPTAPKAPLGTAPPLIVTTPALEEATWRTVDVHDGDTMRVEGPEGTWTVRLIGINAPEVGECFADAAQAALDRLVVAAPLRLVTDVSDVDRYGRKLRYVETAGGTDVGEALVEGGFALARRYPPDTARADVYDKAQQRARDAGLGLWAADACGTATTGVSIVIEVHADAAGNDVLNLNDEWVRFRNAGPVAVDLDGWVVADESASHRYTFHGFVLATGAAVTLHSGCGDDGAADRYWCTSGSAIWNNGGDTVFLRDPAGNNVVVLSY
jgi:micrococcal nuclease